MTTLLSHGLYGVGPGWACQADRARMENRARYAYNVPSEGSIVP